MEAQKSVFIGRSTPRIFVSHSSKDNNFGVKLVDDLRAAIGNEDAVWYDGMGGLKGGDIWWHKITDELRSRPVFIVILSPDALESRWVEDEIRIAWRQKNSSGKRIIPLLYRPCEVPVDLDTLQAISFLPPKTYEDAFNNLLDALRLPTMVPFSVPLPKQSSLTTTDAALPLAIKGERKPTRRHPTKEHKEQLKFIEYESYEHAFHSEESTPDNVLQENDTLPILTNCLAKSYIEKAFEHLPWLERNCLLLFTDAEFTQADIAEILNLNENVVHRYLTKACRLWLQAYNSLLEKELGLSLHTKTVSYSEDLSRVKALIQR